MRSVAALSDGAGRVAPLQPPQYCCDYTVKFIIGTELVVGANVLYFVSCNPLNYSFHEY